ncbi:MAG: tyrosine-type recombinase/integrase [Burkholderiales bacterium]|nr:tyrosine-type recombinase/integrase [Burkholderiales bacterium]
MTADTEGTWVARCRIEETGKQAKTSLGNFLDLTPSKRYDAALENAQKWFDHLGMGGSAEVKTVKQACEAYVQHIKETKDEAKGKDIEARLTRWVYSQPIAKTELAKLNMPTVEAWRKKLAATPVVANPYAEEKITRPRSASSINRDMTALRAALNYAREQGNVMTDVAWLKALKPIKGASKARDGYLDRQQRRDLIKHAPADLAKFLKGLCLLPLRPGALAGLTASHFDKRLSVLTIGKDKHGKDRKITLPKDTAEFFKEQITDKLPAAPIFTMSDGRAWSKDYWKGPIKLAAQSAGLPESTTAYTLRHSTITDLVQVLDLLTVAQISGTSVQMIQAHYGHLRHERAAEALAGLAL